MKPRENAAVAQHAQGAGGGGTAEKLLLHAADADANQAAGELAVPHGDQRMQAARAKAHGAGHARHAVTARLPQRAVIKQNFARTAARDGDLSAGADVHIARIYAGRRGEERRARIRAQAKQAVRLGGKRAYGARQAGKRADAAGQGHIAQRRAVLRAQAEAARLIGAKNAAAARANRLTGGRDTPPSVRHALHQPPLLIRDPYTHRLHLLLFRVCAEEGRVKRQDLRAGRRWTIKYFSKAGNIWPAFSVFMM